MMKRQKSIGIGILLTLLLGTYRGYIALWNDSVVEPCRIYPYKSSLLPESEQDKLANGIPIRDEEHLHSLLQDYLS